MDRLRPNMVNDISYNQIEESQKWRISLVLELLDIQHGVKDLDGKWSEEDLNQILNLVCTQ